MLDKAALLDTLPDGTKAAVMTLLADERMVAVRDAADADKAREAATDLARAMWRYQRHTCEATPGEWQMACPHLLALWDARRAYQLTALAAPEGSEGCECNGSGVYYGHGYVENGVFKGHMGECFRCRGKGYQTPADVKRNDYYDNHVRQIRL